MLRRELIKEISRKKSCLCVGLDTDIEKIPEHLLSLNDPVFEFNKCIVEATKNFCVGFKLNLAFYESRGAAGWESLRKTLGIIPRNMLTIADAKRGDIGNSAEKYAKTFFETYSFDAVTVSPYMGVDSIRPFLQYEGKWVFVLALTSNPGSMDFQLLRNENKYFFEKVIETVLLYPRKAELGFVAGATQTGHLARVRELAPENFLLVPGVGTQGGNVEKVCKLARNDETGALINVSREIIYAGSDDRFDSAAAEVAENYQKKIQDILSVR